MVIMNDKLVFPVADYNKIMKQLKDSEAVKTFTNAKYGKSSLVGVVTALVLKNAADVCMAGAAALFPAAEKVLKPADIAAGIMSL